jgi:hypothetical protein
VKNDIFIDKIFCKLTNSAFLIVSNLCFVAKSKPSDLIAIQYSSKRGFFISKYEYVYVCAQIEDSFCEQCLISYRITLVGYFIFV